MHIETIPLSELVPSPANVRKAKTDVAGLAANIMAHGLLQNLQVCPNGETYEVVAGGRRLAALKYLAKQKKIAADYGVACEVREGPDAVEISLAENEMREAMHPAEQFDAFKKLAEDGKGEEEIAARFGVTPHTVWQRLKLVVVTLKLIAAYRKRAMTLDCPMAFTVADDYERAWSRQLEWKLLVSHDLPTVPPKRNARNRSLTFWPKRPGPIPEDCVQHIRSSPLSTEDSYSVFFPYRTNFRLNLSSNLLKNLASPTGFEPVLPP